MTTRAVSLSEILAAADRCRKAGRLAQADELCLKILEARPEHPSALHLRALIAHDAGDYKKAIDLVRRAIAARPGDPLFFYSLAEFCRRAGGLDDALEANRQALALQPTSPRAFTSAGSTYAARGQFEEAISYLRRAIELTPNYALAHFNLGYVFHVLGDFAKALASKDEAVRLDPNFPDAWSSRGITFHEMGQFDQAEADWKRALALNPHHADAHTNLALSELRRGRFLEGFTRYEWRWQSKDAAKRPDLRNPWKGDDPAGRRLLIHAEQGFGDTLQFCRYLPLLRDRGARLSLLIPRSLSSLIAHSMPWLELSNGTGPASDIQATLLSLPYLMKTSVHTIPGAVPYIQAPPQAISRLQMVIRQGAELKVGLVWAGSPKHSLDKDRSLPFAALAPIFAISSVRFFSLQIGPPLPEPSSAIVELAPELTDFAQTAGAIANLDLVISVDTAVAHLAGAMGKPVWIMLPFVSDWRWLLDREDSPWYPTARLFRQRARGNWGPVISEVADALASLAEATSHRDLDPARQP